MSGADGSYPSGSRTVVDTITLQRAGCGGGSTTVKAGNDQTAGQELLDLQKAYESGVITESQYNDAKKKLLKQI